MNLFAKNLQYHYVHADRGRVFHGVYVHNLEPLHFMYPSTTVDDQAGSKLSTKNSATFMMCPDLSDLYSAKCA
jgi:hypothetical protein